MFLLGALMLFFAKIASNFAKNASTFAKMRALLQKLRAPLLFYRAPLHFHRAPLHFRRARLLFCRAHFANIGSIGKPNDKSPLSNFSSCGCEVLTWKLLLRGVSGCPPVFTIGAKKFVLAKSISIVFHEEGDYKNDVRHSGRDLSVTFRCSPRRCNSKVDSPPPALKE